MFCFKFMPWSLCMIQCLQILYLVYIMYFYLSSMILSQNFIQKYSEIFPKFKIFSVYFSVSGWTGRPDRSTGSCVRTCTLVHVRRPTDRTTGRKQIAHYFLSVGRTVDRPKVSALCFLSGGRPVDPSPTAICQQGGRPTGTVDRQACQSPNGSFLFGDFLKPVF